MACCPALREHLAAGDVFVFHFTPVNIRVEGHDYGRVCPYCHQAAILGSIEYDIIEDQRAML